MPEIAKAPAAVEPVEPVATVAEPEPKAEPKRVPRGHVKLRVLKMGHDKIHTGKPDNSKHAYGEELVLEREIAEALEDRGYAEIL